MLTRRQLVATGALLAPLLIRSPRPALATSESKGEVDVDILTLIDGSASMHNDKRYIPTLKAMGTVLNTPEMAAKMTGNGHKTCRLEFQLWCQFPNETAPLTPIMEMNGETATSVLAHIQSLCEAEIASAQQGQAKLDSFRGTDIGMGLAKGVTWMTDPGRRATRKVINIITDDESSVMMEKSLTRLASARQTAIKASIAVNVVTLGSAASYNFLKMNVMTSPNGFILNSQDFNTLEELFKRKFDQDLLF
jgi:hypothetical protein